MGEVSLDVVTREDLTEGYDRTEGSKIPIRSRMTTNKSVFPE